MSTEVKNATEEQLKEATGMTEFDKALMSGNYGAINAELEAEAKKQGIDTTQARDDKGRFAKTETKPEVKTETKNTAGDVTQDPEEPVTYKMTVEVAPGHSIEVTADTKEACQLKADIAQKAAQLALDAAKPAQKVEEKKPALTNDELFDIGTKLQSGKVEAIDEYLEKNPAVLDRYFEKKGIKVDDLKQTLQERQTNREIKSWEDATNAFKEDHPEYVPSPTAMKLIGYKLAELNLGQTPSAESIAQAYDAAKTEFPMVFQAQQTQDTQQQTQKVEPKVEVVQKKKATSSTMFGVGGGGGDTRPAKSDLSKQKVNLTAEQFNSMSPEQLTQWYNSQVAELTGSKPPGY